MRTSVSLLLIALLTACQSPGPDHTAELQAQIDSLRAASAKSYKPGFGEFMSGIQSHHAKLWFAGTNENWALADFEVHEIMEAFDDIREFQKERPESAKTGMIDPAIDSVNAAIKAQSLPRFKSSFEFLTNSCNACHEATNFSFNKVKIPAAQAFPNQDFGRNGKE